jgi:hypothetical protein
MDTDISIHMDHMARRHRAYDGKQASAHHLDTLRHWRGTARACAATRTLGILKRRRAARPADAYAFALLDASRAPRDLGTARSRFCRTPASPQRRPPPLPLQHYPPHALNREKLRRKEIYGARRAGEGKSGIRALGNVMFLRGLRQEQPRCSESGWRTWASGRK